MTPSSDPTQARDDPPRTALGRIETRSQSRSSRSQNWRPQSWRPQSWRRLALRGMTPAFGQLALSSTFINLLSLAVPIFVLQIYDRVIPHAGYETLKGLILGVALVALFDFLLRQARSRVVRILAMRIDVATAAALYAQLTGAPLRDLEDRSDAEWRQLLRDSDTLRDAVAGPTTLLILDLPFAVLFVAVVAFAAPPLLWVVLALLPIYFAFALLSAGLIQTATKEEQTAALTRDRLTGELVSGRASVKALGVGPALRERWERAHVSLIRRSTRRGAWVDGFNNLAATLALMTTVALTTVGALAIVSQQMSIGALIAANMLAARALQPITQMISLWRGVARFREASQRVNACLARPPERERSAVGRLRPKGEIRLEKASFTYEGAKGPALDAVSLVFRPGRMTGILGANGCGKSTLLKVALGLYAPSGGRVMIDDADIAQFGRSDLVKWIGYLPQEPFLFAGSIRDNIAKARPDAKDEDILSAAERAGALAFIDNLPEGFGAEVGENGRRLSSGQRQRVALARALLENPPALFLDEPSANLDFEAEAQMVRRLTELKSERAIVVVSHSRLLLEACDALVVLHAGRVAMVGRSEEVLPRQRPADPEPAPAANPAANPADGSAGSAAMKNSA